jgi:AraC-like DNA-binding protein
VLYFFFLGLFQSLLTAVVLARKANKRPADLFLLLLVICIALHFLASFLLYELASNPYFKKGFMNFTLLTYGPLMLIFARKSKSELPAASSLWWFLAPVIIWAIPYFAILGFWLAGSFVDFTYLQMYNRSLIVVMTPLNVVCFLWAMRIGRTYPVEQLPVKNLIRIICITGIAGVIFCLALSFYIVANDIPFGLFQQVVRSIGALGLLIVCLAIARYALTGDRQRVFSIHSSPKTPRPTHLTKDRQKEMYHQLADKVRQGRLFLDPDLSMEKLTMATGYSRHQISEVLNQYADISFYPFINQFRVEQVCDQMKKAASKTSLSSFNMLDLSYACGFKSKSAFNDYFRKFTGQTPSQYWGNLSMKEKKV